MSLRTKLAVFTAYARESLRGPDAAKVAGLTALRMFAAFGSLFSTIIIVRFLSAPEAGEFFVFLATTQFIAGAALGPLLILSIRFGTIHKADGDPEAIGRLILFGTGAIGMLAFIVLLFYPLLMKVTTLYMGNTWVFASVVALTGAIFFLGGLARVSGKVISAILPDTVMRPVALGAAAFLLWLSGSANFPALSIAYAAVLLGVCIALAGMIPWSMTSFTSIKFSAHRPYFKAYGPLILYGFASTALGNFDIIIVYFVISLEGVASYKAALQYSILLSTGITFANLIYGPQIAIAYRNDDLSGLKKLARASARLSLGFYILAFAPLLSGPWLFGLAFGEIGRDAWVLALILCVGRFVNAWFGSVTNVANLSGRTALLTLVQGAGVVVLVILGPFLGEHLATVGVAIASALVQSGWVLTTSFLLQRSLKIRMGPI